MNTLFAQFDDYKNAEKAIGALLDHGLKAEHISLISTSADHDIAKHASHGVTTTTGGDAASGAAKGAGIGLAAGALAALASLFIPGFGLVTGGGAMATALAAMAGTTAGGALAGGVTGFLQDQGVSEMAARDYEKALEHGGAVLGLTPDEKMDSAEIQTILHKYGATNINTTSPDLDVDYRTDYERRFAGQNTFDYYQPAYRFGTDLSRDKQYAGRKWEDIEGNIRNDWVRLNPDTSWEHTSGAVRYGYEQVGMRL